MAKLTLEGLKSFVATYVDKTKQAGAWQETNANLYKVLDKVGKMVTIDGNFNDPLAGYLDGDNLPLGKTIEEYFLDLTLPIVPDATPGQYAENALKPYLPDAEEPSYNYTLGKRIIPTSIPYNNVERGAVNTADAANMITKVTEKFEQSASLYRYFLKKQLIANAIQKAVDKGLVSDCTIPTDTASAEAFIKEVKADVEAASFANEGHSLDENDSLIGATPKEDLILFVKKGVMPIVEVDAEAGAFNLGKVAIPAKVVVVDDFGSDDTECFAVLVDQRGLKLHSGYLATRYQENGYSDHVSLFKHMEYTGFISKHTFIKAYTI